MKIKVSELKKLTHKTLIKQGYNEKEAIIIADVLLYAQLRGNNQGVVKLIGRGIPKNPESRPIKIVKNTKLSTLFDGGQNMGMLVVKKALDTAITKAKQHGFAISGTHNTSSSTGAIGYWAKKIAEKNLIGFVFAGSPETVAMHGSYEPIFGTNPLAIGIPTTKDPIVLDMATAAMAWFGLVEAKTANRKIPADVAYDKNGKLTTDPTLAMEGAIRPFDRSYKSAGLSMIVEILTGPLVGATFVGIGKTNNWGNLIIALDPNLLTNPAEFRKNMTQLAHKVKSTKKLPGVKEIYLPGERGNKLTKQHVAKNEIEIEKNLFQELKKAAGIES